jgi:hypothetical protein
MASRSSRSGWLSQNPVWPSPDRIPASLAGGKTEPTAVGRARAGEAPDPEKIAVSSRRNRSISFAGTAGLKRYP